MITHILQASEDIQCSITASPDTHCHTTHDGTILIRTKTESITLHLQRTISHGGVPFKAVDERNNRTPAKLCLTGNGSSEGVAQRDEGDRNREVVIGYTGTEKINDTCGTEDHTKSNEEEDREDVLHATNDRSSNQKGEAQGKKGKTEDEIKELCEKLTTKILKKWRKKSAGLGKGIHELLTNPSTFFGGITSPIQWSYQTLNSSEKKLDLFHLPFHKINIFFWWSNSISKRSTDVVCRIKKTMYKTLKPGYAELPREKQKTFEKQIERYVTQGEVFWLMYNHLKGLLITAPQCLNTKDLNFLWNHRDKLCVSELPWMPEELQEDSKLYSGVVCSFMGVHFPDLPEVPPRNRLNSNTASETGTSTCDVVSIVARGRTRGEATYSLRRPRLEDQSDSHTPPHLEPILPTSVVVEITSPLAGTTNTHATTELSAENYVLTSANLTRKRRKTRDVGDNQWDGNAGSDVSTDAPQPEQHNTSERPNTLPDEQVITFNDGNEGSGMRSRYFTPASVADSVISDNHNPLAPHPSNQDGPEHSRSPSVLSPPSPEAVNDSTTVLIGGSGEGCLLAESTRHSLSTNGQVTTFIETTEGVSSQQRQGTGDTSSPTWQDTTSGTNGILDHSYTNATLLTHHGYPTVL
ncbi:hypothetical protein EKO04_009143 [Ascochyta lentis]|uniref:Uncharacterized protein n=1 Tax=Ascochyta lentis TaxID=205686 RepID=A0A8H7MF86_9PLEO|nr:hypothetical protein EKO04_009143 [Ascochyta lentis]